jgi:hypothetical protein
MPSNPMQIILMQHYYPSQAGIQDKAVALTAVPFDAEIQEERRRRDPTASCRDAPKKSQ